MDLPSARGHIRDRPPVRGGGIRRHASGSRAVPLALLDTDVPGPRGSRRRARARSPRCAPSSCSWGDLPHCRVLPARRSQRRWQRTQSPRSRLGCTETPKPQQVAPCSTRISRFGCAPPPLAVDARPGAAPAPRRARGRAPGPQPACRQAARGNLWCTTDSAVPKPFERARNLSKLLIFCSFSPLDRLREAGVGGSNPLTPTN